MSECNMRQGGGPPEDAAANEQARCEQQGPVYGEPRTGTAEYTGYDGSVAALARGFVLCAGCRDEIVVGLPDETVFCTGCQRLEDELAWRYETRAVRPAYSVMRREDGGMTIFTEEGEIPHGFIETVPTADLMATVVAAAGMALFVFGVLGWFGVRAVVRLGIWMAS